MAEPTIHASAAVSEHAVVHPTAVIGPHAVIESDVEIGPGTRIGPHAVIRQYTRMGSNNIVDSSAVIGGLPQHTRFDDSETYVIVGDGNVFREFVTVNRAYQPGGATRIGSNCYVMAYAHVGHDCQVGDGVTVTNAVSLGGHVEIGDQAVLGGHVGVHQFVRIGSHCMVAGSTTLRKDALPFSLIGGDPIRHYRLNSIGLRRSGLSKERYRALENAFRALRDGDSGLEGIEQTPEVEHLREWLAAKSKYGHYGFAAPKARLAD